MLNKVFRLVVCLSGALVGYGITSFTARPEILGEAWALPLVRKSSGSVRASLFSHLFLIIYSGFSVSAGKN